MDTLPINVQYLVDLLCYCHRNYSSVDNVPISIAYRLEDYEADCLSNWFHQKYQAREQLPYDYVGLQYSPNMEVVEHGFMNINDATQWSTSTQSDMYNRGLFGSINPFCSGKIVKCNTAFDNDEPVGIPDLEPIPMCL